MEATKELMEAVQGGDVERLGELLEAAPALAGARDENGVSVLLQAAYHRQEAIVERLLAAAPSLDVFEAAAFGRTERLRELLAEDPERLGTSSGDGFTALHLAAFFSRLEAVRLLLELGADPSVVAQNPTRVTPLHSAAASRNREMVALLLERGAPVNAAQQAGYTALHSAALHGDEEMVSSLLAHGADPGQAAEDGKKAADFAQAGGHLDLASRLAAATPG